MDLVAFLPPGADRSYNSFLGINDRLSKSPVFLQYYKDDTAVDTSLPIWNIVVLWIRIYTNIISYRDPKFTFAPWTNLHQLHGTKLSFFTDQDPQTDGLAERMIQTLKEIFRRFWAYGLELKDCGGFRNDWCTLLC
ncbi:hypothetical protein O181_084807 [Austropuccinia psidii MF-1]|uniref:Integrase catalytic domain-containing protein n=1 Tax=Austropuccinia psidii MF-1 TaxID=1389203 RepID=A0A9Q3FUX5_9BASI|nr:hypothetical protein [Austropuccinia psidii MF-1]